MPRITQRDRKDKGKVLRGGGRTFKKRLLHSDIQDELKEDNGIPK